MTQQEELPLQQRLEAVYEFAYSLHKGQFRKGYPLPYISHPLDVAKRLLSWGAAHLADSFTVIAAAILHDVVEDTQPWMRELTRQMILEKFGPAVAKLVDELTFRDKAEGETDADYRISKELYIGSFADKSDYALLVKVADRLCNVDDFARDGDFNYSGKYLSKANSLYLALEQRLISVGQDFQKSLGKGWNKDPYVQAFQNAMNDFYHVRNQYQGERWDKALGRLTEIPY
jgi:(p)ppGpp synthase/HD superfamily hydrolase